MDLLERRSVLALALIYLFRMLGLFLIMPVISVAADGLTGADAALIGTAIGIGLSYYLQEVGFDVGNMLQGSNIMMSQVMRAKVTPFGFVVGFGGIICAALILSFYGILAGWMMSYAVESVANIFGMGSLAEWVVGSSLGRNLLFTVLFMFLTIIIIRKGVEDGIEKWSKRLMPMMIPSVTTMALSTNIPSAMIKAPKEMFCS